MKTKFNKATIIVSSVVFAILVILSAVFGILKVTNVLDSKLNAFELIFTILTLGFGAYLLILGAIKKGGYELSIGCMLATVGVIVLLIALEVYFVITIIVGISMFLLSVALLFIAKSSSLHIVRTDEKEDFKPYKEVLLEQKAKEKQEEENTPPPTIKSFKD